MEDKVLLFTHTDLDGVGCAVVASVAFGTAGVDIVYCEPNTLQSELLKYDTDDLDEYSAVYVTDLSINKRIHDILVRMNDIVPVRVFDHHTSNLGDFSVEPWMTIVHELDGGFKPSGTSLFCDYIVENVLRNVPELTDIRIKLMRFSNIVRIYDTYEFRNNPTAQEFINICTVFNTLLHYWGIEDFHTYLVSGIHRAERYGHFLTDEDYSAAQALIESNENYVEKVVSRVTFRDEMVDGFGVVEFAVAIADKCVSDVGYAICQKYPEKIAFIINPMYNSVSLRSNKNHPIDCGYIAKLYGGGGHMHSAGFTPTDIRQTIIQTVFANLHSVFSIVD